MKRPRLTTLAAILVATLLVIDVASEWCGLWLSVYAVQFGILPHHMLLAYGPLGTPPLDYQFASWDDDTTRGLAWRPIRIQNVFVGDGVVVPTWNITVLTGVLIIVLARFRRKPRPGVCRVCPYDLTGNVSGVCPECGQPAESRA